MGHSIEETGISVITPCFNAGRLLVDSVRSIQNQQFEDAPYEIIIIDDGSTDQETHNALKQLESDGPHNLKILKHKSNKGQSAARNTGIKHARYKYILPIDADDALATIKSKDEKGYLQQAFQLMEDDPGLTITYCQAQFIDAKNGNWELPAYSEAEILVNNMIPSYGMFRKKDAEKIGGYNEKLKGLEDWYLWISLLNHHVSNGRTPKVERIEDRHYLYRQHQDKKTVSNSHNISNARFFMKSFWGNPQIHVKHLSTIAPQMFLNSLPPKLKKILKKTIWPTQKQKADSTRKANIRPTTASFISPEY